MLDLRLGVGRSQLTWSTFFRTFCLAIRSYFREPLQANFHELSILRITSLSFRPFSKAIFRQASYSADRHREPSG